MQIIINNQEDYNKFLKRIKYYKYYKFTKFNIKNNIHNKDITIIEKSLNIKKRKQRITYLYDEIVKYLNEYYKDNICDFKDNQCFVQRENKSNNKYGCCLNCKYVKDGVGCISSNISCKLTYCRSAKKKLKIIKLKDIPYSNCLTILQRFILKNDYFSTREQVINDLYYGIIYYLVRSFIKGIKITFKLK
jgi:hypothetical protein